MYCEKRSKIERQTQRRSGTEGDFTAALFGEASTFACRSPETAHSTVRWHGAVSSFTGFLKPQFDLIPSPLTDQPCERVEGEPESVRWRKSGASKSNSPKNIGV
jgi:hypothetical protein